MQPSHFNPTPRGIHGTLLLVTKCPFCRSKRCFPRRLWCPSSISSTIACLCTYTTTTLHDPRFKDQHAWPRLEKTRSRTPLDSLLGCDQGHFNPCDRPRSTHVPRQPTGDAGRPVRIGQTKLGAIQKERSWDAPTPPCCSFSDSSSPDFPHPGTSRQKEVHSGVLWNY